MSTFQDHARLAALFALIVHKTGTIVGRLRVQKLMYLLQQKGVAPVQPFYFEYHHYGPFCAEVADVIKGAVRSRIVQENKDSDDDGWKRFEYVAGPQAVEYAASVPTGTRELTEKVLAVCEGAHWRTLELAATADFLRRTDNLDHDAAFIAALERKPQCAAYEHSAKTLLRQLDLAP